MEPASMFERILMKPVNHPLTRTTIAQPARSPDTAAVAGQDRRRILWIDGVGGYLLLDSDDALIGQAVSGSRADISVVGDLSRQACAIRRVDGDYLLQPLQDLSVDGQPVTQTQLLRDGNVLQIGNRVKLRFTKPSPLSATARLDLISHHRFQPHVDGILLLADSCILGPSRNSHVVCSSWSSELILFRQAGGWSVRPSRALEVNGRRVDNNFPFVAGMRIAGDDFSLSVE